MTEKLKLDLPLVLPDIADERDACVGRLTELLQAEGLELAHLVREDGSARLQTVEAARAPELHAVLTALAAAGEDPVALNTSLNGAGEPIVASSEDALAFFLRHGVDALILEDLLIERPR